MVNVIHSTYYISMCDRITFSNPICLTVEHDTALMKENCQFVYVLQDLACKVIVYPQM